MPWQTDREDALRRQAQLRDAAKAFLDLVRNLVVVSLIMYACMITKSVALFLLICLCGGAIAAQFYSYVVPLMPLKGEPNYSPFYFIVMNVVCLTIGAGVGFWMYHILLAVIAAQGLKS